MTMQAIAIDSPHLHESLLRESGAMNSNIKYSSHEYHIIKEKNRSDQESQCDAARRVMRFARINFNED
ncbi:hypothetical protein [Xanthomonas sp. MUS 060]|uniref:hypothetical protein n=1 Tax=Xanthomonas sp. MUS 060 TaxID=1588031 RepID=UPI000A54A76E|nr:hypothetical protein [Xanthomonas sp. MUS 060]